MYAYIHTCAYVCTCNNNLKEETMNLGRGVREERVAGNRKINTYVWHSKNILNKQAKRIKAEITEIHSVKFSKINKNIILKKKNPGKQNKTKNISEAPLCGADPALPREVTPC